MDQVLRNPWRLQLNKKTETYLQLYYLFRGCNFILICVGRILYNLFKTRIIENLIKSDN